jgi:hypothetical protein
LAIRRRRIGGGEAAVRQAKPAAKRACHSGIVKVQQGLDSEVLPIGRSEGFALLNFTHSRDRSKTEKLPRSAPGAQAKLALSPLRGENAAFGGMPGACHSGMVKNQRGEGDGSVANRSGVGKCTAEFLTLT